MAVEKWIGARLMRTAGVIGGFGPETTAQFYMAVIKGCQKRNAEIQPSILIKSVSVPYSIHHRLIIESDLTALEDIRASLADAAHWLERGGADFIVMPCNTLHAIIQTVKTAVRIPVLSIVDETVQSSSQKRIGLLATTLTLKQGLYQEALRQRGITVVLPSESAQKTINMIIDRLVSNEHRQSDRHAFIECIDHMEIEEALLACTDLQLLLPQHLSITIRDTMQVLADATVREILKET